jgi:hypothetical protein
MPRLPVPRRPPILPSQWECDSQMLKLAWQTRDAARDDGQVSRLAVAGP